ncbi:MAG TPA: hypothetical protein VFL85_02920 [Candidatus Saccharimonadales bacterium]|nr:hypothetical protein [Candidatus Saccharimonadales bacterium]
MFTFKYQDGGYGIQLPTEERFTVRPPWKWRRRWEISRPATVELIEVKDHSFTFWGDTNAQRAELRHLTGSYQSLAAVQGKVPYAIGEEIKRLLKLTHEQGSDQQRRQQV